MTQALLDFSLDPANILPVSSERNNCSFRSLAQLEFHNQQRHPELRKILEENKVALLPEGVFQLDSVVAAYSQFSQNPGPILLISRNDGESTAGIFSALITPFSDSSGDAVFNDVPLKGVILLEDNHFQLIDPATISPEKGDDLINKIKDCYCLLK